MKRYSWHITGAVTMIKMHHPRFIWKRHLGLIVFSSLFVAILQFLVLYIITTLNYGAIIESFINRLPYAFQTMFATQFFRSFSAEGAVAFGLNHPLVIALMSLNAIIIPARHVAGEIEDGTLELMLTYPLERWRHIMAVWFSSALQLVILIFYCWLGSLMSIAIFHELTWQLVIGMLKIGINLWLLFLLVSSYTLLISSFGKEGGKVGTEAAAITLIFYLVHFLSSLWDALSFLKPFNIFYYYLPQELMYGEGSFAFNAAVLTVLISICLTTAIIQFNRRDVPG
ncbi:MAG: ABC transporter permease subunit [bacterium]|nr:ABC transporter permease subunit [bacterium]